MSKIKTNSVIRKKYANIDKIKKSTGKTITPLLRAKHHGFPGTQDRFRLQDNNKIRNIPIYLHAGQANLYFHLSYNRVAKEDDASVLTILAVHIGAEWSACKTVVSIISQRKLLYIPAGRYRKL